MSKYAWDRFYVEMCRMVATKSKDRSGGVGAVIVGEGHQVLSIGYNGFPREVNDDKDDRHERPAKYMWTEHAERNAIYNAARSGICTQGATIYVSSPPCADCARAIIQAGIDYVIIDQNTAAELEKDERYQTQWAESVEVARTMFEEAFVEVERCSTVTGRVR